MPFYVMNYRFKILLICLSFFFIISNLLAEDELDKNAEYKKLENILNDKGTEYKKLEVYFVTWDTITNVALTPEAVMKNPDICMVIFEEYLIEPIIKLVHSHTFKTHKSGNYQDARLVLKFTRQDGKPEIYYSDRFWLLTGDSKMFSELDDRLLQQLNVFTQNRFWLKPERK